MAFANSGLYYVTFSAALANTIALDLSSETNIKVAMFTNSLTTPNFDTDTGYSAAPYTSNEVSGTGYSAGGLVLTTTTFAVSSGTLLWNADDASWTSSTITNARGALVYDNSLTGKPGVCAIAFGADYSTSNGTFTIQWSNSPAAVFSIDLTP